MNLSWDNRIIGYDLKGKRNRTWFIFQNDLLPNDLFLQGITKIHLPNDAHKNIFLLRFGKTVCDMKMKLLVYILLRSFALLSIYYFKYTETWTLKLEIKRIIMLTIDKRLLSLNSGRHDWTPRFGFISWVCSST